MKRLILLSISLIVIMVSAQETYDFDSKIEIKKTVKQEKSPYAIFGDNTFVLQTKHEEEKKHVLEIPIMKEEKHLGMFQLDFQTGGVSMRDADNKTEYQKQLSEKELARFMSIDRYAEKYYSISPYVYVANNPMKFIDPTGDSLWFSFENDVATMHYTAKMLNMSSSNTNLSAAASGITTRIQEAFEGASIDIYGRSYTLNTDIQISPVSSMSEVAPSDHLFVMADNMNPSMGGITNEIGGKVVHLNAGGFYNEGFFGKWNKFGKNDVYTGAHEAGHTFGLEHPSSSNIGVGNDIMKQGVGNDKAKYSPGGVISIYNNQRQGNLNKGVNYSIVGGVKIPYQGVRNGDFNGTVGGVGFRYKGR